MICPFCGEGVEGNAAVLELHFGRCPDAPAFAKNCALRTANNWPPIPDPVPTEEAAPGSSGAAPTSGDEYDPPEVP